MILTKQKILDEISRKNILIEPFKDDCIGPNSYDIHLGRYLGVYSNRVLDAREHNAIEEIVIAPKGHILQPGTIYLGVSEEYTETKLHVPVIFTNSSAARLGIQVNPALGSLGHSNTWTMEIHVSQPVRVYHGMPIANLFFYHVDGAVDFSYSEVKNGKYKSRTIRPVESMMWKNDF